MTRVIAHYVCTSEQHFMFSISILSISVACAKTHNLIKYTRARARYIEAWGITRVREWVRIKMNEKKNLMNREKKMLWSGNVTSDLIGHKTHYHAITKRNFLHLICYSLNICYLSRFQNQFFLSYLHTIYTATS